jgi:hypothetical protein
MTVNIYFKYQYPFDAPRPIQMIATLAYLFRVGLSGATNKANGNTNTNTMVTVDGEKRSGAPQVEERKEEAAEESEEMGWALLSLLWALVLLPFVMSVASVATNKWFTSLDSLEAGLFSGTICVRNRNVYELTKSSIF